MAWTTALLTALAVLPGCANLGPSAIRAGRTEYNVALGATRDEQLLLNIVRMRYYDPAFFLRTTSLTTTFTFSPEVAASASLVPGADSYGLRGSYVYEEKPTVSYAPLSGQDYVEQVLTPVSFSTFQLLSNTGWSVERLLRLCVDEINGVSNASRAAGPTPEERPEYESFLRIASLFRTLQLRRAMSSGSIDEDGEAVPTIQFARAALESPEYRELVERLGLTPGRSSYRLLRALGGGGGDVIAIETRSFAAMLFFLSQSVEVPARDEDDGRVTVTRDETGERFDWSQVTGGLRVRTSAARPDFARVAVRYRGSWFFLDDTDVESKATFLLLTQLSSLLSGKVDDATPVLTLPIG